MVRGEEAEYAGSRPAAIYPRTLEAEREREEKQKQEDESKERQKEEARQREIDESYARMQRDRTDIFNTGGADQTQNCLLIILQKKKSQINQKIITKKLVEVTQIKVGVGFGAHCLE